MTSPIPYVRDMTFEYGVIERLSPLIRRVVACNPSPFTFHGTGTYIVGPGAVAVIDPGPALGPHVAASIKGLGGETVSHQIITHTHRDHSPAARLLGRATGAKTYGFGPHGAGLEDGVVEEGADHDFTPDVTLRDGDVITGDGWTLTALHTPGHTSNHMCFALGQESVLFTGDHVMGWSSTVIVQSRLWKAVIALSASFALPSSSNRAAAACTAFHSSVRGSMIVGRTRRST